jgi:hypothetical protein
MAAKKPPHPLRVSEIERFERNLSNWLKLDPAEALYHRFQGILEGQIVTLQICGVITSQGAVKLHVRMSEARRKKDDDDTGEKSGGLKLV